MNLNRIQTKALPLIALIAAASIQNATAETISISTADELRSALTNKDNKDKTLEIVTSPLIVESNPPSATTIENDTLPRPIYVTAVNTTITGTSSVATTLQTTNNGDLLDTTSQKITLKNITISGSGNALSNADGRIASLAVGNISLEGDVAFTNRFFAATSTTKFGAAGGAIYSSLISDNIFAKTDSGEIKFSNITTYGNTISVTNSNGETTSKDLSAAGGAIYLTGAMRISGPSKTTFSGNRTESLASDALGGAVYVTNVGFNSDGTSGGSYDPNDEVFGNAYGFIVNSSNVNFSSNTAAGKNVYGGAIAVSGGALQSNSSTLTFSENTATGTAKEAFGGAVAILNKALISASAGSTLLFEKNKVASSGDFASVQGGGIYIKDSTATISAGINFQENSAIADGDGASASGGAIAIDGKNSIIKISGTSSDTFLLSKNSVKTTGAVKDESVPNGELEPKIETRTPQAAGGAISISAGTAEFAIAGTAEFSQNNAIATGTDNLAYGGAIFVSGEKTKAKFTNTGTLAFNSNSSTLEGERGNAGGGAIKISGGETTFNTDGAISFSSNITSAKKGGNVEGGAISVSSGKLQFTTTSDVLFSQNSAEAKSTATATSANGGAISQSGGEFLFDSKSANAISFENNTAKTNTGAGAIGIARGGAIHVSAGTQKYTSTIATTSATFKNNSASVEGTDIGSTASGGAIAVMRGAALSFSGKTIFETNSASATASSTNGSDGAITASQGGAIYSAGTLSFADLEVKGNSATAGTSSAYAQGGGIYLAAGTLSAGTVALSENKATSSGNANGGAIYQSSGEFKIDSLTLDGNNAEGVIAQGGGIYSAGTIIAKVTAGENLSIKNNNTISTGAESFGGAIYKNGGSLTISGDGNIEASGNNAIANGDGATAAGGFYYARGGMAKFLGTATAPIKISNNNATAGNNGNAFGGAIYLAGGVHEFTHAEIKSNNASGTTSSAGGAIYIDASVSQSTTLILGGNTEISGNTAGGFSSGIEIGNATSSSQSLGNATIKITSAAKIETTVDENGSESTTYKDIETVTLIDPIDVDLTGTVKFEFLKDNSAGNLKWAGANNIKVASGEFSMSFGHGVTTFESGFSITGTKAKTFDVLEKATINAVSGSDFPAFSTMNIAGTATINIAGTMSFSDSQTNVATGGKLTLNDGATASVIGGNVVTGIMNVSGNITFNGEQLTDEATTLKASSISVSAKDAGGIASVDFNYTGLGTFEISADSISFEDSGTITLGTGTKLFINEIKSVDTENSLECIFKGTGTVVILDSTKENGNIVFSSYYDSETKTYKPSKFAFESGLKVESGILVSPQTTLTLGAGSGHEYKRVVINGGTLLAENSSLTSPQKLYDLQISSGGAILGKAGENNVFEIILDPSATIDDGNGGTIPATEPNKISISSELSISETTTLIGDVSLGHIYNAKLSGAGTLKGDVSGNGIISIAKLDGSVDIARGKRMRFAAQTEFSKSVTNAGTLTFSRGANISIEPPNALSNTGSIIIEGDSIFKGALDNIGSITISGVLQLQAGSIFSQSSEGKIDLSSGGAIDFSAITGTPGSISLAGTIVIDPTLLGVSTELDILPGLNSGDLDNVKFTNLADQNLTDRIKWDSTRNTYIFLGLNGTNLNTTLYGDLTRENIFRTYDFMRAGMLHAVARSVHPPIFGATKATSKYMRGYLERQARERGETINLELAEKAPGDFAQTMDRVMNTAWFQTQYTNTKTDADGEHQSYDLNGYGGMLGSSLSIGESSEVGVILGYTNDRMKTTEALPHKIDTTAYEIMGFTRFIGESFDATLGLAGIYSTNDSTRGEIKADFNSWQVGILSEFGYTFRPYQSFEVRPYTGFQSAYSRSDSFNEDVGNHSLNVDSSHGTSFRTTLGMGFAFLPVDAVQLTFRGAWLLDLGTNIYSTNAYDSTGDIEYSLRSREAGRSALELGAYINWKIANGVSIYGGYTGAFRSGNTETKANLGVQFTF